MHRLLLLLILATGSAQAMIYRPPRPLTMWDTWLFPDGDEYHLFFLQSRPPHTWDTLGRAVSRDLIHWTPLPPIPTKGAAGEWDEAPTLTGCTVRDGERVATFYGADFRGVQSIGVMFWEPALRGWVKHPENPILVSRPPHYSGVDWRDLAVYREADGTWFAFCCAQAGGQAVDLPALHEKTLVAWVTIGDPASRGGSVLTIEQPATQRFDALVYGELAEGRWMPGSELLRRSPAADAVAGWPAETAGPEALIQIAAVYRGDQVTLYRDGAEYGRHRLAEPFAFEQDCALLLGLRHLGAARPACFFAGGIDDARLYDRALSAPELAALRPNEPSDPAPLAWFDFEDGTPTEKMGRFPAAVLHGGARIEAGRLILDGADDYLITPASPGGHAAVAYLTSRDLVHWEYHPPAFASGAFGNMEVPDYFQLGDWHYLIFSSSWTVRNTGGRERASGCWYVRARSRLGPYEEPADALLVPAGQGRLDNYVGRTIAHADGRLLYHHTAGGEVCWAEPKLVRQHPDGSLDLVWWPRLSALETGVRVAGLAAELTAPGTQPLDTADADLMLTARITVADGSAGLTWRRGPEGSAGVRLDPRDGSVSLVRLTAAGEQLVDRIVGPATPGEHHLRVMVRAHRVSVYLDDRWLFGTSLPDLPAGTGAALWVADDAARFRDVRAAGLEPLP